jgi:PBP1b-binding outer membrane lipoprotein LpoB
MVLVTVSDYRSYCAPSNRNFLIQTSYYEHGLTNSRDTALGGRTNPSSKEILRSGMMKYVTEKMEICLVNVKTGDAICLRREVEFVY